MILQLNTVLHFKSICVGCKQRPHEQPCLLTGMLHTAWSNVLLETRWHLLPSQKACYPTRSVKQVYWHSAISQTLRYGFIIYLEDSSRYWNSSHQYTHLDCSYLILFFFFFAIPVHTALLKTEYVICCPDLPTLQDAKYPNSRKKNPRAEQWQPKRKVLLRGSNFISMSHDISHASSN